MPNLKFPHIAAALLLLLIMPQPSFPKDVAAVKSMDIVPYKEAIGGFKETIRARVYEYVISDATEKDDSLLLRLRNQKTDLIFTLGTSALNQLKGEFKDTPIIYSFVLNPETSVEGEKRNITGIDMNIPPYEQFSAILRIMPKLQRIGVIYDPSKTRALVSEAEAAAADLGIKLVTKKIKTSSEAINAIAEMEGKVNAIWMAPDTTAITPESIEYMLLFSFRSGIPLIGLSDKYVKNGALLALSFDNEDIGRQAAEMAMKILNGEDIRRISVLKPRKFKLSINLNTAQKIGLTVPSMVLKTADRVY